MIDYVNVKPHGKAEMWMRRNKYEIKVAVMLFMVVICSGIDGWLM